jgi:hypothetical protein
MDEEIMVTVIATGFNRRGSGATIGVKTGKGGRILDRIPTGVGDLQKLDEPAYIRRGVDIAVTPFRSEEETGRQKIDKADPEKPAFLRKIMD